MPTVFVAHLRAPQLPRALQLGHGLSLPATPALKGKEQALSLPALSGEKLPSATPFSRRGGLHPSPLQVVFQAQAWLSLQGLPVT